MKIKSFLSALLSLSLLSFGLHAWADDNEQDDQGKNQDEQGEDCQGGDIDGSETLVATVTLVATTNAPAGASGVAKLISENEDGVVSFSFSLSVTGLTAGVYDLSIVRKSDSSVVSLGQFRIGKSCRDDDDGHNDNEQGDGDHNDGEHNDGRWAAFLDDGDVELPPSVDPLDIAQIVISDSNGNILLTGDLVDPAPTSTIKFRAKVHAGPASSGSVTSTSNNNNKAQARSTVKRGKRTDSFTMIASGVAPNSTFTVRVNGQEAGTVKSNRKGKVLVRKLPVNLLVVRSVHLVDSNGTTVVRAKF